MKQFGAILAFVSAVIAAPTPGYPNERDRAFVPFTAVKDIINAKWPIGEKRDCVFWTGFDHGIPRTDIDSFVSKVSGVSWYSFFTDEDVRKWQYGLGDANAGYAVGITSAAYAERCGQDGNNVWVLIPSDRNTADPYPQGSNRPRPANWNVYEQPFVTMPNQVTKIVRVDPASVDADMQDSSKIIWKKGDGQVGITKYPATDSSVWDP